MARVMNNLGIRPLLSHPPSSPRSPPTQYSLTTRQNQTRNTIILHIRGGDNKRHREDTTSVGAAFSETPTASATPISQRAKTFCPVGVPAHRALGEGERKPSGIRSWKTEEKYSTLLRHSLLLQRQQCSVVLPPVRGRKTCCSRRRRCGGWPSWGKNNR